MKPGPAHCTVQPDAYLGPRPPGCLRQPTTACPVPCTPARARRRRGGTVGRPSPRTGAADQLATSAPCAAYAAATSSCVPRLYPLRSYHAGVEFLFVSSPLASALLLPLELAVATLFPTTPSLSEPGNHTPTFPSPCRTLLELAPWTSGPRASSSPATFPPLHRPPSTAASSAPLTPSTPPVALPELWGACRPHQPSQRQPADPLTGAPLRLTTIIVAIELWWASRCPSHQIRIAVTRACSQVASPPTNGCRPSGFGRWVIGDKGNFPSPVSSAMGQNAQGGWAA
jgi:hypothetical protein